MLGRKSSTIDWCSLDRPPPGRLAALPGYLKQVIARLNAIFGEATATGRPDGDGEPGGRHRAEDVNTMAQVANNPRDVAMAGNIQGTVQAAVVRAMLSHQAQT